MEAMGYASEAKAVQRDRPSIFDELNHVDDEAKELHAQIEELERRLGPILTPLAEPPGDKLSEVRRACSDVTTRIVDHGFALSTARGRLRQLLQRIEL